MYAPFLFGNSYFLIIIIGMVLGLATQWFVNHAYRRWSEVPLDTGRSGAEVARAMLDEAGLRDVGIETVAGHLSDHYDPRERVLRLSSGVYAGRSVAAAGIAAHEAGHAVQHARAFAFANLRQALVPAANIGSQAAFPLIFLGMFLGAARGSDIGGLLVQFGVIAFGAAVLFQIVTLPVEFDASRRALASLGATSMLSDEQVGGARTVLSAAALTYIAATLVAILQLLYFMGLARDRR